MGNVVIKYWRNEPLTVRTPRVTTVAMSHTIHVFHEGIYRESPTIPSEFNKFNSTVLPSLVLKCAPAVPVGVHFT